MKSNKMPALIMAGILILSPVKKARYNVIVKAAFSGACGDIIRNND
jgi:hypothetical protein